jgi:hypothetical protein
MRPKKHETTGSGDLFRARLDQIINMGHELAQLAGKIDWDFIDGEIAPLYSDSGRPGIATRFVIGLFLLKHIYGLSDEGVCERWVYDPYFQHFTGEEFFQHEFPHERSDLSHWRKRLGAKLELPLAESLRVAHESGALRVFISGQKARGPRPHQTRAQTAFRHRGGDRTYESRGPSRPLLSQRSRRRCRQRHPHRRRLQPPPRTRLAEDDFASFSSRYFRSSQSSPSPQTGFLTGDYPGLPG